LPTGWIHAVVRSALTPHLSLNRRLTRRLREMYSTLRQIRSLSVETSFIPSTSLLNFESTRSSWQRKCRRSSDILISSSCYGLSRTVSFENRKTGMFFADQVAPFLVPTDYQALLTSLPLPPSQSSPLPPTLSPRVLEGLLALSSFLINQTTRFLKSPTISPERRRIARENVPWNKVSDPVKLSREVRKNVLRAMGRELDEDCFKPHGVEEEDGTVPTVAAPVNGKRGTGAGLKRKGTEEASPAPTKSAKIKHAGNAGSPPPPGSALANQGEIISRHAVPVPPTTRFEVRVDPKKLELGARLAEIRETRNSQMVARRWEEKGETFVEMRTVHTIIERVKWSDSIKQEEQPQPSFSPYGIPPGSNPYYAPPSAMNGQPYPSPLNAQPYPPILNGNSPQPPTYPYPYPLPQSFAQQPPPFYHYPPQPSPQMNGSTLQNGNHLPPPQGQHYADPSVPPHYPPVNSQQPSPATKSPSINSILNGTPS